METLKETNRKSGKLYFLLTLIALTSLFFSSCKKDDSDIKFTSLTGTYVITVDHNETNYQYPYHSSAIVIYRGTIPKSYSLRELASETNSAWEIVLNTGNTGTPSKYSFQSYSSRNIWWSVGTTYSLGGTPEFYLGRQESSSVPDRESSRFIIHDMGMNGGVREIVIESLANRGHYLEKEGHTLAGNGLRFVSKDKPESATRFRLNGNVVGTTIEGV
jgi:hypothetical protein